MNYRKSRLALSKSLLAAISALFLSAVMGFSQTTNAITKLLDFDVTQYASKGYAAPVGHVVPVGTNLWFLTGTGGTFGAGGVNSFDYYGTPLKDAVIASFDNSGKAPIGSLVVISNQGWFTASQGGTGAKGALLFIDVNTFAITNVYSFPTNPVMGSLPHGDVTQIGNDLWFLTSSGGVSQYGTATNARGTLVKYSLVSNTVSLMLSFDGTNYGAQPNGSILKVGNAYYFTTFTGGANYTTTTPNGAGALDRITFDTNGNPVITKVADMLETGCFPTATPTQVGKALWFTGAGSTTYPGALIRYDLVTGVLSNAYLFTAANSTNMGKQAYSSVTAWNNELYLTTLNGGTNNKGTILKYTITNGVMTKLYDLDGTTNNAYGSGQIYNSAQVVVDPTTPRYYMNFLIKAGGAVGTGYGTMLAVSLPAPDITVGLNYPAGSSSATLSWTGGYAPFTVQATADPTVPGGWTNLASGLASSFISVPISGNKQFFRVLGNP